jgi:hypothetical protein
MYLRVSNVMEPRPGLRAFIHHGKDTPSERVIQFILVADLVSGAAAVSLGIPSRLDSRFYLSELAARELEKARIGL